MRFIPRSRDATGAVVSNIGSRFRFIIVPPPNAMPLSLISWSILSLLRWAELLNSMNLHHGIGSLRLLPLINL